MTAPLLFATASVVSYEGSAAPIRAVSLERDAFVPGSAPTSAPVKGGTRSKKCYARAGLRWYVRRANHWRAKMGAGMSGVKRPVLRQAETRAISPCPLYLANVWKRKSFAYRQQYERWIVKVRQTRRSLYEKWRCIHEHEGAWNANTGNGYYGGLQMDHTFQTTYGPEFYRRWGTADKWPVWAQITAAERAYHSGRGFGPWPNTRIACGV